MSSSLIVVLTAAAIVCACLSTRKLLSGEITEEKKVEEEIKKIWAELSRRRSISDKGQDNQPISGYGTDGFNF